MGGENLTIATRSLPPTSPITSRLLARRWQENAPHPRYPPAVVGQTLGAYRLVGELGRGGMGAVYLGVHELLGRRAAIKVLLPEMSADRSNVERFFNEARATTAVS